MFEVGVASGFQFLRYAASCIGMWDSLRLKGGRMKSREAVKTPRRAQPIKIMTVREVSDYLHVHPITIYRLLKSNQIPAFRVGDWRFNVEVIDRWRSQQEKAGAPSLQGGLVRRRPRSRRAR
jgi:excisionase family DNA binding protein